MYVEVSIAQVSLETGVLELVENSVVGASAIRGYDVKRMDEMALTILSAKRELILKFAFRCNTLPALFASSMHT